MILILGDRAANVDITWYHWPCNIDITKNRFYVAARIDKIVISELVATDRQIWDTLVQPAPAAGSAQLLRINFVRFHVTTFLHHLGVLSTIFNWEIFLYTVTILNASPLTTRIIIAFCHVLISPCKNHESKYSHCKNIPTAKSTFHISPNQNKGIHIHH